MGNCPSTKHNNSSAYCENLLECYCDVPDVHSVFKCRRNFGARCHPFSQREPFTLRNFPRSRSTAAQRRSADSAPQRQATESIPTNRAPAVRAAWKSLASTIFLCSQFHRRLALLSSFVLFIFSISSTARSSLFFFFLFFFSSIFVGPRNGHGDRRRSRNAIAPGRGAREGASRALAAAAAATAAATATTAAAVRPREAGKRPCRTW